MDKRTTISSKAPIQANTAISPVQGQQGGNSPIQGQSVVRHGQGSDKGWTGQGGLRKGIAPKRGAGLCKAYPVPNI